MTWIILVNISCAIIGIFVNLQKVLLVLTANDKAIHV